MPAVIIAAIVIALGIVIATTHLILKVVAAIVSLPLSPQPLDREFLDNGVCDALQGLGDLHLVTAGPCAYDRLRLRGFGV